MTAFSAKPPCPSQARHAAPVTPGDLACLAEIPLFHRVFQLRPEEFVAGVSVVACADGTILYRQGEAATLLYAVADGGITLNAAVLPGQEKLLHLCRRGEFCGEEAFVQGRRLSSARTVGHTRLVAVDPVVLDLSPRDLAEHFYRRLSGLTEEIVVLKSVSPVQRLARLLLDHVDTQSGPADGEFPLPKKTVAAKIGVDPASLSRLLRRMRAVGVSVRGNSITIQDVGALRGVAERAAPMRGFRRPVM